MKKFLITLLFMICSSAYADSMECLQLKDGSINQLELRAADKHMNCFYLESSASLKQINIISKSIGSFGHTVTFFEIDQYSQAKTLASYSSDANGLVSAETMVAGRKIGISVVPASDIGTNKHLTISYITKDGYAAIVVDISQTTIPPKVICTTKACKLFAPYPGTLANGATATQCSKSSTIPLGKNQDFDIDANLADVTAKAALIAKVPDPLARELMKAFVMFNSFYKDRPYDLKKSTKYPSSEQFGNYFYGMVAMRMGYTEQTAVTAGAVVQQVQNLPDKPNPGDYARLARNLYSAATTGLGDNPGDPEQIRAGYKASSECTASPQASASMGRGGEGELNGLGKGWQGGSISLPPGCNGNCNINYSFWSIIVGPLKRVYPQ